MPESDDSPINELIPVKHAIADAVDGFEAGDPGKVLNILGEYIEEAEDDGEELVLPED